MCVVTEWEKSVARLAGGTPARARQRRALPNFGIRVEPELRSSGGCGLRLVENPSVDAVR